MGATAVHFAAEAHCLYEQFQCEKPGEKLCRCSGTLDAAGVLDCKLRVTKACTLASLPCYAEVLGTTIATEAVFALAPLPTPGAVTP